MEEKSDVPQQVEKEYEDAFVVDQQTTEHLFKCLLSSRLYKKSPEDVVDSFPGINIIRDKLVNLSTIINIEELSQLKKSIFDLQEYYCKEMNCQSQFDLGSYGQLPFEKDVLKIVQRMEELSPPKFMESLIMSSTEEINEYFLYDIKKYPLFAYDDFISYCEIWNSENQPEKYEFLEQYDEIACSDWSKMQPDGESFGGYYNYPEDSYEKQNAYQLTRDHNGQALWELPYPKTFIIKTISLGCSSRQESVRYSNFICEWMKRKILQMNS
jgi:hypothetical protein